MSVQHFYKIGVTIRVFQMQFYTNYFQVSADRGGHVTLWPHACWDCGFETRQGDECLSFLSVKRRQAEVCDRPVTSPREVLPSVV
jgi:hypothetical protein